MIEEPHPQEDLSALLDGELPDDVAERVYVHVLTCSECAAELDAARRARLELRSLPAVDPPPGFYDNLVGSLSTGARGATTSRQRMGRGRRWVVAQAGVAVAAGLVLVIGGGGQDPAQAVAPQVASAIQRHAATLSAVSDASDGFDGFGASNPEPPRATKLGAPYVAPAQLAGYRLVDAFQEDAGVELLYAKGGFSLSLFEQRGSLDTGDLALGATETTVGGRAAWQWNGGRVLVVGRRGVVVTLVGDESGAAVLAAAAALPGQAQPLTTRLRRACSDVLAGLSPAG